MGLTCSRRVAVVLWVTLGLINSAHAQSDGFRLNRYHAPATPEDGLALQYPSTLGNMRWALRLSMDYARAPLAVSGSREDLSRSVDIVGNQLSAHVSFALGISDRFELVAAVPMTIAQSGDNAEIGGVSINAPSSAAIGDPALGGAVRIYGEEQGIQLGASATVLLPAGNSAAMAGDGKVGARGLVLGSYTLPSLVVGLNAGLAYRPERHFGAGADAGTEILFVGGVHVPIEGGLRIGAEVNGATRLKDAFGRYSTPLEALLGVQYAMADGFHLGAAGGLGLGQTVGVPSARFLATVGYAAPVRTEEQIEADNEDSDGDRIDDPEDQCVEEPEDYDGFQDEDGCPDSDNDEDGLSDSDDMCPDEAEDEDGFSDADGCPEPDNDEDGVLDAADQCPLQRETHNGFQDDDGCPDQDPTSHELAIALALHLRFARGSDTLPAGASVGLLRLARALNNYPGLDLLIVEGHASADEEPDAYGLSRRRASGVQDFLIEHGEVNPDRLRFEGFGDSRPFLNADTEEAQAGNRRVVFRQD